jgi:hypothetical protein
VGTQEPACVQLLAGMFTVLAEAAPLMHDFDSDFVLDPALIGALQQQMSTPQFHAPTYFRLMMRRIRMFKRLPAAWLQTAANVNSVYPTIDLGKLRMITDQEVKPVQNARFTLADLKTRYQVEVDRATSAAAESAFTEFRESYLDHEVVFTDLTLLDVTMPSGTKGALQPIAVMEWVEKDPNEGLLNLTLGPQKSKARVKVKAVLADRQYVDVSRFPKQHRVLIRGRLFNINKGATEVELREALLFEDRDWTRTTLPVDPAVVAACSAAVNDLNGLGGAPPGTGLR